MMLKHRRLLSSLIQTSDSHVHKDNLSSPPVLVLGPKWPLLSHQHVFLIFSLECLFSNFIFRLCLRTILTIFYFKLRFFFLKQIFIPDTMVRSLKGISLDEERASDYSEIRFRCTPCGISPKLVLMRTLGFAFREDSEKSSFSPSCSWDNQGCYCMSYQLCHLSPSQFSLSSHIHYNYEDRRLDVEYPL